MGIINILKVEVMANTRRGRIQMMGVRLVELTPGECISNDGTPMSSHTRLC